MVKKLLPLGILLLTLLLPNVARAATSASPSGRVYLVIVDKLSVSDLDRATTPHLVQLLQSGAVGLQSNRTLGSGSTEDGCLTIGAGNLAHSTGQGLLAMNVGEEVPGRNQSAGQLYHNLTGKNVGTSRVVLVNLPEIEAGMEADKVTTRLGAMGEILRQHHRRVCVVGNGDIKGLYYRTAVAIAMDAEGRVPAGNVGPITSRLVASSFVTEQTNYNYIKKRLPVLSKDNDLLVIELSDLARLEKSDIATPDIGASERKKLLYQIDSFVGWLMGQVDLSRDLLIVASPSPAAVGIKNKDTFTPVMIKGAGYTSSYLTSGATRRPYIVANTDLAPTILRFFRLRDTRDTMVGQPMTAGPAQKINTLEMIQRIDSQASMTNRLRAPLVKGYVVLQIVVIALTLICLLAFPRLKKWILPLVFTLVVVPLVLLPLGWPQMSSEWEYIALAVIAIIIITLGGHFLFRERIFQGFVLLSVITLLALDLDVLTGSHLIQSSVLGYDPMAGARYYGIGNEFLGVLIGSSIITAVEFYRKVQHRWALALVGLFFLFQCYLVAAPGLGAQSDGVITAPLAFLVTFFLLSQYRINPRLVAVMGILVLAAVSGLVFYDMSRPPELQSHIGRAANQIMQGGVKDGLTIIARKLGMNVKLIRYTIWSRVFMVILAALAVLLYRPAGAMARARERNPFLFKGFIGILTGAVVGGIINDSGIVTAATTSIYLVTPIMILMLDSIAPAGEEPASAV